MNNAMNKKVSILAIEFPAERVALRVLSALLIVLTVGYLYFVAASVLNVIARKEAISKSASLESAIGVMEQHYFALSQAVTPQEGATMGLAPIDSASYVYRSGNVGEVSIQSNII